MTIYMKSRRPLGILKEVKQLHDMEVNWAYPHGTGAKADGIDVPNVPEAKKEKKRIGEG